MNIRHKESTVRYKILMAFAEMKKPLTIKEIMKAGNIDSKHQKTMYTNLKDMRMKYYFQICAKRKCEVDGHRRLTYFVGEPK